MGALRRYATIRMNLRSSLEIAKSICEVNFFLFIYLPIFLYFCLFLTWKAENKALYILNFFDF